MRICIYALLLCCLWANNVNAAAVAAADTSSGYAGAVLEKITRNWTPPQTATDDTVRISISIDGKGKMLSCNTLHPASNTAVTNSVCAAAKKVANYDSPPYGLPITVYLTFWTGKPGAQTMPAHNATQNIASAGIPLVQAPATAGSAPKTAAPKATLPPVQPKTPSVTPAPTTTAPMTTPPMLVTEPDKPTNTAKGTPPATTTGTRLTPPPAAVQDVPPPQQDAGDTAYVNAVMRKISPHVIIPGTLPNGKHVVILMLRVDAQGNVIRSQLERSSQNEQLDSSIMQAVGKTPNVGVPPSKNTQDLHLTFVVQKP